MWTYRQATYDWARSLPPETRLAELEKLRAKKEKPKNILEMVGAPNLDAEEDDPTKWVEGEVDGWEYRVRKEDLEWAEGLSPERLSEVVQELYAELDRREEGLNELTRAMAGFVAVQ